MVTLWTRSAPSENRDFRADVAFDMFAPDEKPDEITIPDVGEYTKSELLAMEKEVLGIYASGHPLDEYEGLLNKM